MELKINTVAEESLNQAFPAGVPLAVTSAQEHLPSSREADH